MPTQTKLPPALVRAMRRRLRSMGYIPVRRDVMEQVAAAERLELREQWSEGALEVERDAEMEAAAF